MLSRRSFLALAGAAVPCVRVSAQRQGGRANGAPDLPAAIASLRSMRDLAHPISRDERRARIEKARRLMVENGLDAILLTGGTSLLYFSGVRWGTSERLFAVVLPAKGDAFVICPAFERDRAHEQLAPGPLTNADVRTWQEH